MDEKQKYCKGCDSDFYNGKNQLGIQQCWHLKDAKVETRYMIGWWVPMSKVENFTEVQTLSCHTESGKFAFLKRLPAHLRK